jgi:hypothetical protein
MAVLTGVTENVRAVMDSECPFSLVEETKGGGKEGKKNSE